MCRFYRIYEVDTIFAPKRQSIPTSGPDTRVNIKCLPHVVNRGWPWGDTGIYYYAYIGLKNRTKSLKNPAMRVNLVLRLSLDAEDNLNGEMLLTFCVKKPVLGSGEVWGILVDMHHLKHIKL
jgi:hypothetical protein